MNDERDEKDVERHDAQIIGRTEGPFGSDDADADVYTENKNTDEQADSANGLDSQQVRGGQDGRNNRGMGSTDMDSKNGVLRMGDTDDGAMQVTDAAISNAAASEGQTKTAMVDVTTETSDRSGPDDYASSDKVGMPNAQKAAKEQNNADEETSTDDDEQAEREEDIAETGTDLNNQPAY